MAQASSPTDTEPTQEQIEAAVARGSEAPAVYDGPVPDEQEQEPGASEGWLNVLQADTPESEIHHRAVYAKGQAVANPDGTPKTLAYVTARFVMDRLDAAVGPANWMDTYEDVPGGVRCTLTVHTPDGGYVSKTDVGVPSSIEPVKGQHSDAFKRAAVKWGIARDLYDERDETAPVQQQGNGQVQQVSPIPQQQTLQQTVMQADNPYVQVIPDQPQQQMGQPAWLCPLHNDVKIIPGGISKKTGKPYSAFFACPVSGCDQTGGNIRPTQ